MSAYRRSPHTAWREVAGEWVVIDLAAKRMYGLDAAAGRVWSALEGATMEQLQILAGTRCERERDVLRAFVAHLVETGLAETCDPSPNRSLEPSAEPFAAPAILWDEEMARAVGLECGLLPAQSPQCTAKPFGS